MTRSFTIFILSSTFFMLVGGCATIWNGEPTSQTVLAKALAEEMKKDPSFKVTPEMIRGVVGVHNTEEHRINAPLGSEIVIAKSAYGSGSNISYRQIEEDFARRARAMIAGR